MLSIKEMWKGFYDTRTRITKLAQSIQKGGMKGPRYTHGTGQNSRVPVSSLNVIKKPGPECFNDK